jgi:Mg2+-importing ATPase
MTELLIMLVIRTQKPFFRSRPGKYLLIGTLIVGAVTLVLPYSPLSRVLGFTPLSLPLLLVLGVITLLYVLASDVAKSVFYTRVRL